MEVVGITVAIILILMLLECPIALSFAVGTVILVFSLGIEPHLLTMTMYWNMTSFVIVAVPFFMLCGNLMTDGGISEPLFEFVDSIVGRIKGGMFAVVVGLMPSLVLSRALP